MASSAAQLIAVVLIASCVATVAGQTVFGGASSIDQYAPAIVRSYRKIPAYASVGSGAGVRNFISGAYLIGASDDALDSAQNSAAGGTSKYTLPLTLAAYAFVTKKSKDLRLKGWQIAGIYRGTITRWSQIKKGLTGNIIPVARLDSSGTTAVIGSYLRAESSLWPLELTGTVWQGVTGISPNVVYRRGSSGVAAYTAANVNAITYVQSGIGINQYKLFPASLYNPARNYVLPTKADPAQSIPRTLPSSNGNWAGVSLLRTSGRTTYPLVSFVYMFAKRKYRTTAQGTTVRTFLTFTMGATSQNLARSYFFFRLPTSVINKNLAAIKTIR